MIKTPCGISLHYFHGMHHNKSQGTISRSQLENIIRRENVISAKEWISDINNGLCLTFDDGLRCQYDIALPLLNDYGLTAIWAIPTLPLVGGLMMLEISRQFRNNYYDTTDEFYNDFFNEIDVKSDTIITSHLSEYSIYTDYDRKFRYYRDIALKDEYPDVIMTMMKKKNIDIKEMSQDLWINRDEIKNLSDDGHIIGLHTHTHPTNMKDLPIQEQEREYGENFDILYDITQEKPIVATHPCNSYNNDTLQILRNLGIRYAFGYYLDDREFSDLEIPRLDVVSML